MNRLRREHRTQLAVAPREIDGLNRRAQEILKLMLEGFRNEAWKDELRRLDERRSELEAITASGVTDSPLAALHPHMADVFRQKTEQLAAALESDTERDAARQALRGFLEKIVIPPGDGLLQVVGNLGEMLTAAGGRNGSPLAAVAQDGCGGSQPAEFGVRLGSGVKLLRIVHRPSSQLHPARLLRYCGSAK